MDNGDEQVEWEDVDQNRHRFDDHVGRLPLRMGSNQRNQRTGGPWSNREKQQHINCLELLAAMLALQTFTKNLNDVSILLRLDNSTAVAYINNKGGTVLKELILLTRSLWVWCLERNIKIVAQHLSGSSNKIADEDSCTLRDHSDWMLNPQVFNKINRVFVPLEVDVFASRLTSQLPIFYSWTQTPLARATDALIQDWTAINGFANPPWVLVGQVCKLRSFLWHQCGRHNHGMQTSYTHASGAPTTDPPYTSDQQTSQCSSTGTSPPTSRMAHLREKYAREQLSEEATDLMLKSWRTKTNKSYDSLFNKWSRWCSERGSDPFSGPIGEVVNFLAHLFKEGYQYRSLNAYRSAISSTYEKVDGVCV